MLMTFHVYVYYTTCMCGFAIAWQVGCRGSLDGPPSGCHRCKGHLEAAARLAATSRKVRCFGRVYLSVCLSVRVQAKFD